MIKAILFDFDGVIAIRDLHITRRLHEVYGVPNEKLKEAWSKYKIDYQLGDIDFKTWCRRYCNEIEIKADYDGILDSFKEVKLHKDVLHFIKDLKKDYKTGLISDCFKDRMEFIVKKFKLDNYFDKFIFSYETKLRKTDPKAFENAAKIMECKPEECVYIDNDAEKLTIAEKAKMKAIYFDSELRKVDELKQKINSSASCTTCNIA